MRTFWPVLTPRVLPVLLFSALLVSALLQTVIFPVAAPLPFLRAQLAWIALVPWFVVLLHVVARSSRPVRSATLLSYFCGALWYAGHCYWIFQTMHQYGHLSTLMAGVVLILFCLYLGLYHALFGALAALLMRSTAHRLRWATPFLLALLWVAVELARAHVTSFPWDLLGYSQVDNAALDRLAPLAGVYAIGFLVALVNALLACGIASRLSRTPTSATRWPIIAGATLSAFCIVAGALTHAPSPAPTAAAVLVQPNLAAPDSEQSFTTAETAQTSLEAELAQRSDVAATSARAAGSPPHLILWPEAPTSYEMHDPGFQQQITALAVRQNSTVIVDANAIDADSTVPRHYRLYNAAGLFTAAGLHARYEKIHLVPFGEFMPYADLFRFASGLTEQVGLFDRGRLRIPLRDGTHTFGTFICYESIFPAEVRQLVLGGADVLINLSDDGWYGDTSAPFQHINMARMRAIENRRWLLRDTNTGITASIDPFGNVRESAPRHQRLAAVMHYGYSTGLTFYTRHGDWFADACTALTLVALLFSGIDKPQPATRKSADLLTR